MGGQITDHIRPYASPRLL